MPHPLDAFERIYIINLASRTDRRAEMAEQLEGIGLTLDSDKVHIFPAVRPTDAWPFPSVGSHGCFMSHLGVLREAKAAGLTNVLLLEDDVNFSPDFMPRASQVMGQLVASDWALFYGGHEVHGAVPSGEGNLEIPPALDVQTAHFLAFRGRAIATLVGFLEAMLERQPGDPHGGPMHVDGAYCWFRRAHPAYRTFVASPALGYQRSSRTDIHSLRWIDRVPGVRRLVALLRRNRNRRLTGRAGK